VVVCACLSPIHTLRSVCKWQEVSKEADTVRVQRSNRSVSTEATPLYPDKCIQRMNSHV
jgi:hypothetical protein